MITELRQRYKLRVLLDITDIPRSTYYYHFKKENKPDKYDKIKKMIVIKHKQHYNALGYRRMCLLLNQQGIKINHKTVLKLMNTLGLRGKVKRKKYKSYKGNVGKVAANVINRNFKAEKPYEKLTTDVTEFSVFGKKVYLSPVLDMFNNEILSYSISESPNFQQTREMLKKLIIKLPSNISPILHSDQGWQYQMKQYRRILKDNNIKQSMSRKGNCLDNSIMESFFGRMKVEMFYDEKFESISDFKLKLSKYIDYYNKKRVTSKLKRLTPKQYRNQSHMI